jgi:small subunit ribosomal protein S16
MLAIRLQRIGRKNEAHFRVVLTDSKNGPKSGRFLEILGSYNPKLGTFQIDHERAVHWIKNGAKPSDTLHNFLVHEKIIEGKKRNVLSKKSPTKKRKEAKAA